MRELVGVAGQHDLGYGSHVGLQVSRSNTRAVRLYTTLGFREASAPKGLGALPAAEDGCVMMWATLADLAEV